MHATSPLRAPFARTFAVSLLLTGVTGLLSHSALAQPPRINRLVKAINIGVRKRSEFLVEFSFSDFIVHLPFYAAFLL